MEQYLAVIIPSVVGLIGAMGYAIRQIFKAQADKLRTEAEAAAKTMIEETERRAMVSRQSLELKMKEFEMERDAQQSMNALVRQLIDQLARSNDTMMQALQGMGVIAVASKQAIVDSAAKMEAHTSTISQQTTALEDLKQSVNALQKVIVELPDTLQGQHSQQNATIQVMVGVVNTLKAAVDQFVKTAVSPGGNAPEPMPPGVKEKANPKHGEGEP